MPSCRPVRRRGARAKQAFNADLQLIAEQLADAVEIDAPEAWLDLPWLNGWNAAEAAREIARLDIPGGQLFGVQLAQLAIHPAPESYEQVDQLAAEALKSSPLYATAFRVLQMQIANSDGGGRVANALLLPHLLGFPAPELRYAREVIRRWRCWDAIGTSPQLRNDVNDNKRRAFMAAWDRGLYRVAYALPRAVNPILGGNKPA